MRSQSFGCGARRAAADAIRVNDADIRIKPSLAVVLYLPQTVEERLRQRHLFTLAGLHLRLRPVDRIDFRPGGAQRTEKIIPWSFIHLVKMVLVQIVEHRLVPCQRLFAWKMTFNHRAPAALNLGAGGIANVAHRQFAKRDNWPYRLPLRLQIVNFRHPGCYGGAQTVEHRLYVADLRA